MPATSGKAIPVVSLRVVGSIGAQAPIRRIIELASQTFLTGTPLVIDSGTGALKACPTIHDVNSAVIYGFATEFAANLATTGVPQSLTYGSVQNQPSAVLIPVGAPPNDGTTGALQAVDQNVFNGIFGDSSDNTLAVLANTLVGKIFGLTKDAGNGYWYVDNHITATASGACVQVTELVDPVGTLNGRVGFVVLAAAQQVY